jgi:hypothetical protein
MAPHSTQLNATDSPLLRLPGELRNKIFEYVLGDLDLHFTYAYGYQFDVRLETHQRNMLGLLFVCRQAHAETALLHYALNTFNFTLTEIFDVKNFLQGMSAAQRKAIQRIYTHWKGNLHTRTGAFWAEAFRLTDGLRLFSRKFTEAHRGVWRPQPMWPSDSSRTRWTRWLGMNVDRRMPFVTRLSHLRHSKHLELLAVNVIRISIPDD